LNKGEGKSNESSSEKKEEKESEEFKGIEQLIYAVVVSIGEKASAGQDKNVIMNPLASSKSRRKIDEGALGFSCHRCDSNVLGKCLWLF
jgi:hypothetical protein